MNFRPCMIAHHLFIILSLLLISATQSANAQAAQQIKVDITKEAKALAQAQLDAYNARDLERFLEPYSDSVKIYDFPNELRSSTKEAMRKSYGKMFQNMTDLHCELVNRTAIGNVVIDHESVTFSKDRSKVEVFAIYHVRHGKIQEVHFLRADE